MFYLWLADAEPNSNYGEFVAAAYEAEAAKYDEPDQFDTGYLETAYKAELRAWDRMVDRR